MSDINKKKKNGESGECIVKDSRMEDFIAQIDRYLGIMLHF